MKITKPKDFPIEFSMDELETIADTLRILRGAVSTLKANNLTTLIDSGTGNCCDIQDLEHIHDALLDLSEMDVAS
jgi:hypothetical protein